MLTPSQTCHLLSGAPAVANAETMAGLCYFCAGASARGVPVMSFLSSSFTDQNRVRCPAATHVCEACTHVSLWTAPPGRPPGKCPTCEGTCLVAKADRKGKAKSCSVGDPCPKCNGTGMSSRGYNWRLFSHLYEEGWSCFEQQVPGYLNATKGEKPLIRAFLEREHEGKWFAAIADSGQKHIVQLTRWNAGNRTTAGLVMFDEQAVHIPGDTRLVSETSNLLTAGATKAEVETGRYGLGTVERCEQQLKAFEEQHRGERGSPWFSLALWLAQRDEEQVAARMAVEKEAKRAEQGTRRKAAKSAGGAGACDSKRLPARAKRTSSTGLLHQTGEQPVAGGGAREECPPLRDTGTVGNAAADGGQLRLFGAD